MSISDYANKLHRLLRRSRPRLPVPIDRICDELECSLSTANRAIRELRYRKDAPLVFCKDPPGYYYSDEAFELEGMWLTTPELLSLLAILELLQSFDLELVGEIIAPFRQRIERLLISQGISGDEVKRIRLLRVAAPPPSPFFREIMTAVLQRRRLSIGYDARSTGKVTQREVSPQRLVHYRDKWYIDAWCHRENALRTFRVDRIAPVKLLETAALDIPDAELDAKLIHGYGIYSGEPVAVARLLFSPECARWVAGEIWCPGQTSRFLESGEYLLEIPYARYDELILDVMRYGSGVEVLGPSDLRQEVARRLLAAAQKYF